MKWGCLLLIALVGCATPRAVERTPPMPPVQPKASRASTPRMALAQAPKTLWLVWGPKTWVEVAWDRNPETNGITYAVWRGNTSRNYDMPFNVRDNISAWIPVLPGTRHYFAVTAIDSDGLQSDLSEEVTYDAPVTPPFYVRIVRETPVSAPVGEFKIESRDSVTGSWQQFAAVTNAFLPITATENRFFRVLQQP